MWVDVPKKVGHRACGTWSYSNYSWCHLCHAWHRLWLWGKKNREPLCALASHWWGRNSKSIPHCPAYHLPTMPGFARVSPDLPPVSNVPGFERFPLGICILVPSAWNTILVLQISTQMSPLQFKAILFHLSLLLQTKMTVTPEAVSEAWVIPVLGRQRRVVSSKPLHDKLTLGW